MSTERMIRLINLKAVMKRRGMLVADLARALGKSDTYAGKIYNGKDVFNEKTSGKIEKALGLPHKWLDESHDLKDETTWVDPGAPYEAVSDATPMNMGEAPTAYGSPFLLTHGTNFPMAPVVAWASLGETLLKANKEWPASESREVPTSRDVSEFVKWVVVEDDHPVANIKTGDMVAVDPIDPHRRIARDQVGLFRSVTGDCLLRRYNPLPSTLDLPRFEAVADDGRVLDSERHGLTLLGVCVGRYTERF
jgi:transcriptional regulator with XRE-family HTH domain